MGVAHRQARPGGHGSDAVRWVPVWQSAFAEPSPRTVATIWHGAATADGPSQRAPTPWCAARAIASGRSACSSQYFLHATAPRELISRHHVNNGATCPPPAQGRHALRPPPRPSSAACRHALCTTHHAPRSATAAVVQLIPHVTLAPSLAHATVLTPNPWPLQERQRQSMSLPRSHRRLPSCHTGVRSGCGCGRSGSHPRSRHWLTHWYGTARVCRRALLPDPLSLPLQDRPQPEPPQPRC